MADIITYAIKSEINDKEEWQLPNPYYCGENTVISFIDYSTKEDHSYKVVRYHPYKNSTHYSLIWEKIEKKNEEYKKQITRKI